MEDKFAALLKRYDTQQPPITHEELERQIAHCVGEDINAAVKEVTASASITSFAKAMQEKFGMTCEISPALSLYVSVSNELAKEISVDAFSSLPFEDMLKTILQRDTQTTSAQEIAELAQQAINESCEHFLNAIILSHPLLMKIFQRLHEEFQKTVIIVSRSPVKILFGDSYQPDVSDSTVRPGMYL